MKPISIFTMKPLSTWERIGSIVWSPEEKIVVCQLSRPNPATNLVEHYAPRPGDWTPDLSSRADLITAAPALANALIKLLDTVRSLSEQQAMPDEFWRKDEAEAIEALKQAGVDPDE